jgi:hypothetical protein
MKGLYVLKEKRIYKRELPLWGSLLAAVLLAGCITLLALWCQPNALRTVLAGFKAQPLLIVLNALPIGLLLLAFAFLFPDTTVLLFFILPVKMKWLAYLDGALFAFDIIKAIGAHNWAGVVLPIVALLNFAVFIWPEVHYLKERTKYQNSRKTVQFRQAQQQQAKQAQQQGYRHKCAVCGRTDTDYPDLQFRYCSKCVGYHCFCQDHIFNHVHFTEE